MDGRENSISLHIKEAFKVALSVTIAMGIALWMDWEKPHWAAFGVVMISLPTMQGQSLNKGAMRMLGTLLAVCAAITFLALFPQQRWPFMAVLSLYVGFCAYMMTGKKHQYFWYASGFICVVIAVHSSNSLTAFEIMTERVQETGTGILVYSLVSALLWPINSRDALEQASRRLFDIQIKLYRSYRDLMAGQGSLEDSRPLRDQELRLLDQIGQLLDGAETDSYAVREVRHAWRQFHELTTTLAETLGHWRSSLPDDRQLDLTALLRNLDGFYKELDLRLDDIERMLNGKPPQRMPQTVMLAVNQPGVDALAGFEEAAAIVTKIQLDRLEGLTRTLFECVSDLKGFDTSMSEPVYPKSRRRLEFAIDPDRFQGVIAVLVVLWSSFLVWVYLDPPGHASFILIATASGMVAVRTGASCLSMALWSVIGAVAAGIPYVFIMPHLSTYAELGLMIFLIVFAICYLFPQPRQVGIKMGLLIQFIVGISIQNEQTYSFASFANNTTMTILAMTLLVVTTYFLPSPRPEKLFLRMYRRFFRHAALLISTLDQGEDRKRGLALRWKRVLYRNDLLQLPGKLAHCAEQIDYLAFPANTKAQVQAIVSGLYVLAFRIKDLIDARSNLPGNQAINTLLIDFRAYNRDIESRFQHQADNPAQLITTGTDVRQTLATSLNKLETGVRELLIQSDKSKHTSAHYESLYRLLGIYRSLTEAQMSATELAAEINWAQWQEARF